MRNKWIIVKSTPVTTNYVWEVQYDMVEVGTISAPISITLPTPGNLGDTYIIKDGYGSSAAHNITVEAGSNLIDGASTLVISNNYLQLSFTWGIHGWSSSNVSLSGVSIVLAGDVTGASGSNTVASIQGVVISGTPSAGETLIATSPTAAAWSNTGGTVTLSGDVTGAADANTVAKIHGSTVPAGGSLTTGNGLYVSGASALSYSALNLAGGAGYVTGALPNANQAAQTMGGAVGGTTAASTISLTGNASITGALPVANIAAGTSAQVLMSNGTPATTWTTLSGGATVSATGVVSLVPSTITLGGYVTGAASANTVSAIQGNTVTSGALVKGDLFIATTTSNWAATAVTGDVAFSTSTPGATTVVSLTGASGVVNVASTGNVITWNKATTAPGLAQTAPTTDVATANLTLTPQAPFASASTNVVGGNLLVALATPLSGTTESLFQVNRGASHIVQLGADPGTSGADGALWLGPITASGTNYSVLSSGSSFTALNGVSSVSLSIAGSTNVLTASTATTTLASTATSVSGTLGVTGITTLSNLGTGIVQSSAVGVLSNYPVTISGTPSSGQVLTATSSTAADWQTPGGGSGITALTGDVTASGTGSVAATVVSAQGGDIVFTTTAMEFAAAVVNPSVIQLAKTTNSGTGSSLTIQAQNETGTTSVGGALILTSGTGTSTNGAVDIQAGGTNAITISGAGVVAIPAFTTAGLVHNAVTTGVLTSSLLVNADVATAAAIAVTKLAAGTSAQILLNNATPTPTWTTMSGDVTIGATGTTTVGQLQGTIVLSGTPSSGQVLTATSSTAADWQTPSSGSFTAGGDLSGTSTSQNVVDISGASGIVTIRSTGNILQWVAATTAPGINQLAAATESSTTGSAGANMTITAQGGQPATGGTNAGGVGGNLNLEGGNGGTSGGGAIGVAGSITLVPGTGNTTTTGGNIQLFNTTVSVGTAGIGCVGISNAGSVPTGNPSSGVSMYSTGGNLQVRGSAGAISTLSPVGLAPTGTQSMRYDQFVSNVQNSSATASAFTTYTVTAGSANGGYVVVTAVNRATGTASGVAVGDSSSAVYTGVFQVIGGTVAFGATPLTLMTGSNQTSASSFVVPVITVVVSSNTMTFKVATSSAVVSDCTIFVDIYYN